VRLYDADPAALETAGSWIRSALKDLGGYDLLNGQSEDALFARIALGSDLPGTLDGVELVQENVPERLEVKLPVLAELDRLAAPDVILASSTSGLLPSALSEPLAHRERLIVAHPLNPPYLVPAVELAPAPWTDPDIMERAARFYLSVGMAPLRMHRELPGFIMNRLQGALKHEAWRLVAGGYCSAADVDRAVAEGLGLRWSFMGPFETAELNAPTGIREYVERYGPLYREIGLSQSEIVSWEGEVLDAVEESRRAELPADAVEARREWRDRRLMGLAAHKREADQRWGR
ncbi:MAG: 3-hydroxyacyl-CoA dehydrogenase, partial [Armatimonadetes bacterium]|nr:3-hydroxyacyl-CoA dehydrogenase [Armatimonadota bacterium]